MAGANRNEAPRILVRLSSSDPVDGAAIEKQVLADTVPVMSGETAKADRYEYKSDCSLSY